MKRALVTFAVITLIVLAPAQVTAQRFDDEYGEPPDDAYDLPDSSEQYDDYYEPTQQQLMEEDY